MMDVIAVVVVVVVVVVIVILPRRRFIASMWEPVQFSLQDHLLVINCAGATLVGTSAAAGNRSPFSLQLEFKKVLRGLETGSDRRIARYQDRWKVAALAFLSLPGAGLGDVAHRLR